MMPRHLGERAMKTKSLLFAALLGLTAATGVQAQQRVDLPITNEEWTRPFPAFKVIGNVYYVGTYDLVSVLITTNNGHILINSGANGSESLIRTSVEALGFRMADIKILLSTHAHRDHVGALGALKQMTGARMLMHEADVPMLESGGHVDYRRPEGRGIIFDPVKVDQALKDGDKIRLGNVELTVHHHPGHTKGSVSFSLTVAEGGRNYSVLVANMPSVNEGMLLLGTPLYANAAGEYAQTFARQKSLSPDIWLASHAGQFGLHRKYKPGDAYDPNRFVDQAGWRAAVERLEKSYLERLAEERRGGQ
jgi:metallo-beta-lactamase class B